MCGIVGAVVRPGALASVDLERAVATLSHRGPDASGVLRAGGTDHWEVWLGHARLAIVDLSPGGAQPMTHRSPGAAGAITFNGEVYDHAKLREHLAPDVPFASRSDTEVLLAGLLREGPRFLTRANAMLALGLWDERRRRLVLARDRLGKKPLYVYRDEDRLLFASEIKAIAALGAPLDLDSEALALFRWLGYVPDQRAIWRRFTKLPAATFATLDLGGPTLPPLAPETYWDPLAAMGRTRTGSVQDSVEAVLALLDDATRIRLDADVPVGVFLSGGIDSSLVASSVARAASRPTTAFTVQAADPALDESAVARDTAARLGLAFEALPLPTDAYERQASKLAWHYDEPMADLSQIALMANAEAARARVTVVLTGDGGDESFLGYPRVAFPDRLWRLRRRLERVPGAGSLARSALRTRLGMRAFRASLRAAGLNDTNADEKRQILDATLRAAQPADLFERFECARQREALARSDQERLPRTLLAFARAAHPGYAWDAAEGRSLPELLGALDLVLYLRGDILVKTDRATMAYSLEARCPWLDYRLVELGLSLPLEHKVHAGVHKRVLRLACEQRVGAEVATRRKQGFGIPTEARGDGSTDVAWWAGEVESRFAARWPAARAQG